MVRILLAVLSWPVLIFAAIWVFEWLDERYLNPPDRDATFEYDHPRYTSMALDALDAYRALDEASRQSIRRNLGDRLLSVDRWLSDLDAAGFSILCLGEDHIDLTRDYLAAGFFSKVSVDVLFLEATSREMADIVDRIDAGEDRVEMLGADVAGVVRAARGVNPDVEIVGIEETQAQKADRLQRERAGIRDESIVRNVWAGFRPGRRHVILYGAIHCNNWPNWLYQRLRGSAPAEVLAGMRNVKVVERKQDALIDPFVLFLDGVGSEPRDVVVDDTGRLDPQLLDWFALMVPQIFSQYQTIWIYRSE